MLFLLLLLPTTPVEEIAKEEQGEFMNKLFWIMQGKHSSRGKRRHIMARRGVELTLKVNKQEMGWVSMSPG